METVQRCADAGIVTKTSQSVKFALLGGLSYCNFGHTVESLTDDYLSECEDYLYSKAIEAGKSEDIKWPGLIMLTNIVFFKTNNLSIVKQKMQAYKTLFEVKPILWLEGWWEDKKGETIHFYSRRPKAVKIGRKYVLASIDEGTPEFIKPVDAQFEISEGDGL